MRISRWLKWLRPWTASLPRNFNEDKIQGFKPWKVDGMVSYDSKREDNSLLSSLESARISLLEMIQWDELERIFKPEKIELFKYCDSITSTYTTKHFNISKTTTISSNTWTLIWQMRVCGFFIQNLNSLLHSPSKENGISKGANLFIIACLRFHHCRSRRKLPRLQSFDPVFLTLRYC